MEIDTRFSFLRFIRRIMIFRFAYTRSWVWSIKKSWHNEINLKKYVRNIKKLSPPLKSLYIKGIW